MDTPNRDACVLATRDACVLATKEWRKELDGILQAIRDSGRTCRERSLAITKIQEAIMWLGMDLKALNDGVSCYKHGYDSTTIVEPVADGLKM